MKVFIGFLILILWNYKYKLIFTDLGFNVFTLIHRMALEPSDDEKQTNSGMENQFIRCLHCHRMNISKCIGNLFSFLKI